MRKYELVCMSFDGEYITDSKHETIEEACNASGNIGSKWFFYPFHFILSGSKIIDTGCGLVRMSDKKPFMELMFKGRKITTAVRAFNSLFIELQEEGDSSDCCDFELSLIEKYPDLIRN